MLSTKLKHVLYMYDAYFTMDDDGCIKMTITNKTRTEDKMEFSGTAYRTVVNIAYSYFKKRLKEIEKSKNDKNYENN